MNSVQLIGRLTRDPEVRYSGDNMAIATFSIAIDRPPKRDGTKETDFPRITVFGRQAENCEKYLVKGRLVGIEGRIQTGSYTNRNGDKVYTTDVVANRVEFLEWGDRQGQSSGSYGQNRSYGGGNDFGGGQGGFGGNDFGGGSQNNFGGGQNNFGGGNDFGGGQGGFGGNDFGGGSQNNFGGGQNNFGGGNDFGGGQNDFGGQSSQGGFSMPDEDRPAQDRPAQENRPHQDGGSIPTGFSPLEEDDIPF